MQTTTHTTAALSFGSPEWNARDLYDLLMFDIEQALLFDHLPLLGKELSELSKTERQKRVAHYTEAMEIFAKRFESICGRFYVKAKEALRYEVNRLQETSDRGDRERMKIIERMFEANS